MSYSLVPPRSPGGNGGGTIPARSPAPRHRTAPPGDSPDGAPIDVAKLLFALRRRWYLLVLGVALAGAAAMHWVRSQPELFTARAVVRVVNTGRELAGNLAGDAEEVGVSMLSQLEILSSRAVAAEVVDSVPLGLRVVAVGFSTALLDDVTVADSNRAEVALTFTDDGVVVGRSAEPVPYGVPVSVGNVRFSVRERPSDVVAGSVVVLPRERAIDAALGGIEAEPRRGTSIIDVRYTAADPLTARSTVNAFVHAYQGVDARLARETTRRRRLFIEEQLRETDTQLAAAERAMSQFRTRQQAYSAQEKFVTQRNEIARLTAQVEDLDAERQLAASLLTQLDAPDAETRARALRMVASSSAGATPLVGRLYQQLVGYEGTRTEMTSGPEGRAAAHPEVRRLDTLIGGTRRELVGALQAHVDLLDARLAAANETRARTTRDMSSVSSAEAEETRLSQNADVLRDQATLLRSEYQQVRIAEAASLGQVEIVDRAVRALPLRVDGTRVIAFALFLGALGGAAIAVCLELLDRSIRSRETVEAELGLPLLATVPRIEPIGGRVRFGRWRRRGKGVAADHRRSVALAAARSVRAPSTESFRQLRTNLLYAASETGLRTVMVTSPNEAEGKTSVAVNLATTFAQQRLRVLLVDCDLYASRLHRVFGLQAGPGLQQVVLDGASPDAVVRQTSVSGLHVITAGTSVEGDTLGSPRFRALLRDLAMEFDVILLDSAPVLAVSDSVVLGGVVDAVVLVVRAGSTRAADAVEAVRHLDAVGAPLAGAVLNDPDERLRQVGGHYYTYGYHRRELAGV